jgi:hypothetical protein
MRISDDRYSRDRLRLDVAIHFIRHEARTHTIRQWTGLTDDRIRKLYRSYLDGGGGRVTRHRGKSPQQLSYFLRTMRLRQESAVLASICCLLGVLQYSKGAPARLSPGIGRAVSLCEAYEAYCSLVAEPAITIEHAVLLIMTLSQGVELVLQGCGACGALLVADPLALHPPHCVICAVEGLRPTAKIGYRQERPDDRST